MMTRRHFLRLAGGAAGTTFLLPGCGAKSHPLKSSVFPSLEAHEAPSPLGLATSLPGEYSYEARIEGTIPGELRGTLYRNGPGLFERGDFRKRCILDGDGMVQAFRFTDRGVHFRNKFPRTGKFREEEAAGVYRYATWTTVAPKGGFYNLFGRKVLNQAGVSVEVRNGKLYAFDESVQPYELDPDTLETIGLSHLGLPEEPPVVYSAHSKIDRHTGEWLHFGVLYRMRNTVHLTTFDRDGRLKKHRTLPMPRDNYIHDFFVSDRHIILNLQPAKKSIFRYLFGKASFAESLRWEPEEGNLILVLSREGGTEPIRLMTEASWMWHSLNAYEEGDEIIAEFVGYKNPDHFIGSDPALYAIMSGRVERNSYPGAVRRYVINPKRKTVRQEILDRGTHEFSIVNSHHSCHRHRYGYFAKGATPSDLFWSSIVRIDMDTGKTEGYDFGKGLYCTEPIFAPRPGFHYSPGSKDEPGWLLTEIYNGKTKRSFLAVLRADHVADGPVAIVHLRHHVPFSFHGYWHPAS